MAGTHVTLNSSEYAQEIRSAVALLQAAKDKIDAIKASADSRAADPDYSAIESALGVPPGQGTVVYNTLAGLKAALDAFDITAFLKNYSF